MVTADILIEGIVEFRRHLLAQIAACDKALDRLAMLKDVGGKMPVDEDGLRKAAEELEIQKGINGSLYEINPNTCDHKFVTGKCEKCGVFEEFAEKKDEDIE
jgi:hypothetical protein